MTTINPWPTETSPDPFDRAQRQLIEEERALRLRAEEQVRAFRGLVVAFAGAFMGDALDHRRRGDPYFVQRATPGDWQAFLQTARQQGTAGQSWPATDVVSAAELAHWRSEAHRLAAEVARLTAALAEAGTAQLVSAPLATSGAGLFADALEDQGNSSSGRVDNIPLLGLADLKLPPLPRQAPGRFADQLTSWPREGLALAILGLTGWSMRLAIAEALSTQLVRVKANAGSLRRLFSTLARRGFWIEERVKIAGLHTPDAKAPGETTLVLVRLSALGRELLMACGVEAAPAEWEQLMALGVMDARQAALVCAFTYHARLRGYATAVQPATTGDQGAAGALAEVWVRRAGGTQRVMVVGDGVDAPDLAAAAPADTALVTITPAARDQLVAAAQTAGAVRGVATDLQTLLAGQSAPGPLWAITWGDQGGG